MSNSDYALLRKKFHADGVVFMEKALDSRSLAMAEEAYQWSLAHPSAAAANFPQKDSGAVFYQDLANPAAFPAYRELLEKSPAADLAGDLWGAPDVWFMYEQVFLKEGGHSRRTPWHQDSSYLPIDGEHIAVMWITFEAVAKENALEFVRGSHRGVLYNGSRFDPEDDTAPLYPNGELPRLPNIEAERAKWDIVSWAIQPRDMVVFHPAMLHGGAPTHPGIRRRTLSLRFFGNDATYVERSLIRGESSAKPLRQPSESDSARSVFTKLPETLSPGDRLRHPDFPKLRPR